MRLLLLGGTGLLGTEVLAKAKQVELEVIAPAANDFDVTDPMSAARLASGELGRFDWCVNCAAYTAVDLAEIEPDAAFALNSLAPGYLSKASAAMGAAFMQISTDFVFDGSKKAPYLPGDRANPLSVYGHSKLAGEEAAAAGNPQTCILRTAWLFGAHAKCFPRSIIQAWLAGRELKVVSDQFGSPTYARDLAATIIKCCQARLEPGVYHAGGLQACSWLDLARHSISAYCNVYGLEMPQIVPIATEDWPTPAKRPSYSVLDSGELASGGLLVMRDLLDALDEFAHELGSPDDIRAV